MHFCVLQNQYSQARSTMKMGSYSDEELTLQGVECAIQAEVSAGSSNHCEFADEDRRMSSSDSDSDFDSICRQRRDNLWWTWFLWILLALAIGGTGALCVLLLDHMNVLQSHQTPNTVAAAQYEYGTDTTTNTTTNTQNYSSSSSTETESARLGPPPAIIVPDSNVNYLYASPDTSRAVNSIGAGDFTMSVHIRGTEEYPQPQHPVILSNRNTNQYDASFLFGIHERWRESLHKIPYMNVGGVNWIQYNHPNQPNVLDGDWHHFVARRKATTLSYYVDGELIVDLTHQIFAASLSSAPDQQQLMIGYDQFSPSASRFVGEIQELTVWNMALPIRDIATGLRSLLGDETGLIAYFPTVPLDQSGQIQSHVTPLEPTFAASKAPPLQEDEASDPPAPWP
jgi:Concanavalin A-like lectin/glucanases superfamily